MGGGLRGAAAATRPSPAAGLPSPGRALRQEPGHGSRISRGRNLTRLVSSPAGGMATLSEGGGWRPCDQRGGRRDMHSALNPHGGCRPGGGAGSRTGNEDRPGFSREGRFSRGEKCLPARGCERPGTRHVAPPRRLCQGDPRTEAARAAAASADRAGRPARHPRPSHAGPALPARPHGPCSGPGAHPLPSRSPVSARADRPTPPSLPTRTPVSAHAP